MRLKDRPSHSFKPPATIQTSHGSYVYTFSNGADANSSSEDEFDIMELRPRGGELQRQIASREKIRDVVLLEQVVTEDDNLNKLAIQYGCTVADIKRVNNLIREQDIYALKIIKIPVKVHGLLTEGYPGLSLQQRASLNSADCMIENDDETIGRQPSNTDFSRYFQEIDQDIEAAAQTQELLSVQFDSNSVDQLPSYSQSQRSNILGADWGIRWWNAVLIMLLIGIVLPVFYIIYFKTREPPELSITQAASGNYTSNLTIEHANRTVPIGSTFVHGRSLLGAHRLQDTGQ